MQIPRKLKYVAGVAAAVPIILGAVYMSGCSDQTRVPRAAIVDQLSLTQPNPDFVKDATGKLERSNYVVDYYPGEQVTVDLYNQLDDLGYDLLILRVHTARFQGEWRGQIYDHPVLFTNQLYSTPEYVQEQWELQLQPVFAYEGAPVYFGIAPNFVRNGGNFDGGVILMGCSSLSTDALADSFTDSGADYVIGWNDLVSAAHMDKAAISVLDRILSENLPPQEAIAKTNSKVGIDQTYHSHLLAYTR